MNRIGKLNLLAVLFIGMVVGGAIVGMNLSQQSATAQTGGAGGAGGGKANHTVVGTDGTHLIVTDNKTDVLYFYSIDRDAEIGSDLKLRGKLDLGQIGKDVLTPTVMFKKDKK